jgi:hypothetical protein
MFEPVLWIRGILVRIADPGGPKTKRSGSGTLLKSHKEVRKLYKNRGFSYYLCLMMEGSVLVNNGSGYGSGRPNYIRILRIRIHKTGLNSSLYA